MRLFVLIPVLLLTLPNLAMADVIPQRGKLFMAAQYAELEQLGENELKEDPAAPSYKLMYLCYAYSKLKRYNKLFPCLDRLEDNIKRGDIAANDLNEMQKGSPFWGGLAMMGAALTPGGKEGLKSTVVPYLHLMRAESAIEFRDYEKAIIAANLAMQSIPSYSNNWWRIQALTILGLTHAYAGRRDEAEKYLEQLKTFKDDALGTDKVMGQTKIWLALGEYRKAYETLHSMKTDEDKFGQWLVGAIIGMPGEDIFTFRELPKKFMIVKTQFEVGKVNEAKAGYDSLLANPRTASNGEIYWVLLYDRGRIAAAEGDIPAAIGFWKRAADVIEQQRSTINTEANKIGFVGDKQDVYKKLIAALVQTNQFPEAFDYLERSKSRALVDMLASKKDFLVREGDSTKINELLEKAEQAEIDILAQGGGLATPAVTSSQAAPSSAIVSDQRRLAMLSVKKAIAEAAPDVASLVSVSSTSLEEIQASIQVDEVLVEYFYDDKSLFVFLIAREGVQVVRTDVGNLVAETKAMRDAIAEVKSETYLPLAQRLYQQLVAPIIPILAGRTKLIIVPQGVLHYVPFAALHDGTQYLLDTHAFRLLPSASVMKYLHTTQVRRQGGILAFGNPDLGDPKYNLKFAEEEAKAIVQTVPQSRAVLRKDATESTLRQNASGFNYLHFATHGEFNADAPLDSALMLSKDASSDGLLTVSKLYSMRLDIDLATLSACETGLGKIASGDDVVGLTRGFLFAGTSTIVASLWQVDDQATSVLMTQFYEGLKGTDKREALRKAQIATRKNYPHPFYWAAFELTGNAN